MGTWLGADRDADQPRGVLQGQVLQILAGGEVLQGFWRYHRASYWGKEVCVVLDFEIYVLFTL